MSCDCDGNCNGGEVGDAERRRRSECSGCSGDVLGRVVSGGSGDCTSDSSSCGDNGWVRCECEGDFTG